MRVDYQESYTDATRRLLAAYPTGPAILGSHCPSLTSSASALPTKPIC